MTPNDLPSILRQLRLSGMLATLEARQQQAQAEQWSYAEFLAPGRVPMDSPAPIRLFHRLRRSREKPFAPSTGICSVSAGVSRRLPQSQPALPGLVGRPCRRDV